MIQLKSAKARPKQPPEPKPDNDWTGRYVQDLAYGMGCGYVEIDGEKIIIVKFYGRTASVYKADCKILS